MEKKEANKGTINERFLTIVESKRNQIFKKVLTAVEEECRKFNVDTHFFDKLSSPKKGYSLVRKILLDETNDLVRFISLFLDKVIIRPVEATITIGEKVIRDDKDNKKNATAETTLPVHKDNRTN